MTSKRAEGNKRNITPTGIGTFKTTATKMSILQSKLPLTILIKIKLNTHIIQDISEHNIKIKQTKFQFSLNTTFRLTRSSRLFPKNILGCSVYCRLLLRLDWVMQDIPLLANVNLRVLQILT